MANEWKALWENLDEETGAEKTTQSFSASNSENTRYYSDGQDNEYDEKDRTILGFNTRDTEDDRAGTDYGGYGYSGYSGYGYYDGFDDSDADWYRRGRWRYSKRADYSPSSQFRSTFSRYSYTGSATDDAKNKAIRALRNLTRSANTIVDKTTGSKQKNFTVQFSQGTDSNGVSNALTEEQQRIVYVSPDELLATSTTEDEDAVIDALTGFVLLRVQMAQEIKADVVRRINATGLHAAAFRAAERLFANKDSFAGVDADEFGRATADDYLAGILAKSMLTRLARRGVVANWGGFVPYFIRHAKKFTLVRENLEKAEKSVETVASILGYNMLADEDQIELPKEINDIVSKHLGTEVEHTLLLDKCRELVVEIRDFMAKTAAAEGSTVPAGEIEKTLSDMMSEAQAQQSKHGAGNEELKNLLSAVAGAMGASSDVVDTVEKAREEAATDELETLSELKKTASLDPLLKNLERMIKELETAKKLHEDAKSTAKSTDAASVAYAAKNNLSYALSSRPQGTEALHSSCGKETAALRKMLDSREMFNGADGKEKIEKLKELLDKVCEKGREFLKKRRDELKTKSLEQMEHMQKMLDAARGATDETTKKINDALAKMVEKPFAGNKDQPYALSTLSTLQTMLDSFKTRIDTARTTMPEHVKSASGARSLTTIKTTFEAARHLTHSALASAGHCFHDNYALHNGALMTRLTSEMANALTETKDSETAAKQAVDATMAAAAMTDIGFMAAMVDGFLRDVLSETLGADPENRRAKADELGISVETLNKLLAALRTSINANKSPAKAKALGAETADKLEKAQIASSPVDRHLFGDKIEAKTTVLTGNSISHVNDEARNAAEEEYVAYLDHNNCKPKVVTQQETVHYGSGHGLSIVQSVKTKNKNAIERIRNALQFQSGKRTVETHGLRSGDLDEGSLHKLSYDCEHIWSQKTMSKLPDVAVGILVDQSGSMGGGKIDQARELCITLAEAVRRITGVRLYVYGHTANAGGADLTIYEHYNPSMGADMTRLGGIRAHCNNYDGYAIKDVAKRLAEDSAKRKYLFVIADGLPAGAGYGGETAAKHVTSVCKFTRERLKIGTYAFAVGVHGASQAYFKRQYGENHVVFVDRVMTCLPQIVRFLRNALQQERKLVTIED